MGLHPLTLAYAQGLTPVQRKVLSLRWGHDQNGQTRTLEEALEALPERFRPEVPTREALRQQEVRGLMALQQQGYRP
jgi:DNA-directed RNA polymerase sigma subunit (sigma70/sigma32)